MLSEKEQKDIKNKINLLLSKYFIPDIKKTKNVPRVMNQENVDFVITSSGKWIIIAFLPVESLAKFDEYFNKYNDPFPGLIFSSESPFPVAFHLQNSNYNYFKDNIIKNMYSFKVENDCSFIIENHHQSIKTPTGDEIEYTIDLAYVITFSEKINIDNFYDELDSLIKYSLTIWSRL